MQRAFSSTLTLATALFVTLAFGSLAHAQLDSGLVSYWNFDGNNQDSGGVNTNHGVGAGGGGTTYIGTTLGSGLLLDGGTEHVSVAHHSSLDFSANDQITMSTWFKVDAFTTSWQGLVSKGEGSNFRVARRGGGNNLSYAGGTGDTGNTGPNVNDGLFHHLVAISDAANGTELYIDGALAASSGGTANIGNDPSNPLLFGANPDAGGREWEGVIDDFVMWDRPLSTDEITEIYQGGLAGQSFADLTAPPAPVPEPASIAIWSLLGIIGGFFAWRKRRNR